MNVRTARSFSPIAAAALVLTCISAAMGQAPVENESAKKPPAAAQAVIDDAVKKAKAEKKTVFIHFSASW